MSKTPAQVLMSHGGTQHHPASHDHFSSAPGSNRRKYATGGHTISSDTYGDGGETMKHGGHRKRHSRGGETMKGGGCRHKRAEGGYEESPRVRRDRAERSHYDSMHNVTHHPDGHPQYFGMVPLMSMLAGAAAPHILSKIGDWMGRRKEEAPNMRRGGHRRHHHAEGKLVPIEGEARANLMMGGDVPRPPLGGNRAYATGGRAMGGMPPYHQSPRVAADRKEREMYHERHAMGGMPYQESPRVRRDRAERERYDNRM